MKVIYTIGKSKKHLTIKMNVSNSLEAATILQKALKKSIMVLNTYDDKA